jgi:hypothetical protein
MSYRRHSDRYNSLDRTGAGVRKIRRRTSITPVVENLEGRTLLATLQPVDPTSGISGQITFFDETKSVVAAVGSSDQAAIHNDNLDNYYIPLNETYWSDDASLVLNASSTGIVAQAGGTIQGGNPQPLSVSGGTYTGQSSGPITYTIVPGHSESAGQPVEIDITLTDTASGRSEYIGNANDVGNVDYKSTASVTYDGQTTNLAAPVASADPASTNTGGSVSTSIIARIGDTFQVGFSFSASGTVGNTNYITTQYLNPSITGSSYLDFSLKDVPGIAPTTLAWSQTDGGVDYGYAIYGEDLPEATTVALYWAPTTTFDSSRDTQIRASVINPTGTTVGSYPPSPAPPFHLTPGQLGTPPDDAKYLLAVTDPNDLLGDFENSINVKSIPTPSIALKVTVDGGPDFSISETPSMPQIVAHVQVTGVSPDPTPTTVFTWTIDVHYFGQNSNERDTDYTYPTQTATGGNFTPDFGDVIRGGSLTLTVNAEVDGMAVQRQSEGLAIVGTNPSAAVITGYLNDQPTPSNYPRRTKYDYHKILRQIASDESSLDQFVDGAPNWSHDARKGAGLMQVTPASDDDIWNWQTNIDDGVAIFNEKLSKATTYAARTAKKLKSQLDRARILLHLKSVTLAPLTPNQVVREAIQRYNGGNDYVPATKRNGSVDVTVSGKVGVVHWVETGNGYVENVLDQQG